MHRTVHTCARRWNSDTRKMAPDLTVIMCTYNEMGRIQRAVADLLEATRERPDTVETIIIDNCSTDGTREWLSTLTLPGFKIVFNDRNLGKGGSIKRGIELSRGEYVVIHDPDLEYLASDIWPLLDAAREDGATMALGSRMLGGNITYLYLPNYLGVVLLTKLINVLFGSHLTDVATATKLLKGEFARSLKLRSTGFDLDFEIVIRPLRLGQKIVERRVKYMPRTRAEGKKLRAWRDGLLALRVIIRDRILSSEGFVNASEPQAMSGK